jgi:hypothetical protein
LTDYALVAGDYALVADYAPVGYEPVAVDPTRLLHHMLWASCAKETPPLQDSSITDHDSRNLFAISLTVAQISQCNGIWRKRGMERLAAARNEVVALELLRGRAQCWLDIAGQLDTWNNWTAREIGQWLGQNEIVTHYH